MTSKGPMPGNDRWAQDFGEELRAEVGGFASVVSGPLRESGFWQVDMRPISPTAADFGFLELDVEMIVYYGANRARLELSTSDEDRALTREIAASIILGRLVERIAPGRVQAHVTLASGKVVPSTVVSVNEHPLPQFRWRSRGEQVLYTAYANSPAEDRP